MRARSRHGRARVGRDAPAGRFASALLIGVLAGATLLAPSARAQSDVLEELEGDDADLDVDIGEEKPADEAPSAPRAPAKTDKAAVEPAAGSAPGPSSKGTRAAPEPAAEAAKPPLANTDVEVLEISYEGLLERWDARRQAHKSADAAARARADSVLEEGLRSYGVQGVAGGLQGIDFANGLIEEARRAQAAGDLERALELTAFAERVAPDLPRVHAQRARLKLASSDAPGAVTSLTAWAEALGRDPTSRVLVATGGLSVALSAMLLLLLVFSLVFLVRSFRFLAFDLHNALPRGAARWQLQLLVVLLAALPVVTAAGPVVASLWWLTLAWVYLSRSEQIVVAVVSALLVGSPFAVETVSVLWSWPGSQLAQAYDASYDVGARHEVRNIAAADEGGRSLRERAVLASKLKREGKLEAAYEAWRSIVQEAPQAPWAHNNLGVVAALLGKDEHAIAELEAALARDGASTEAAFNLAQIHLRHGRTGKAQALLGELERRVPTRLEAYRTHTFRRSDQRVDQNRAFVDAAMPSSPLADLYRAPQPGAAALEREVAGVAFFGLKPSLAAGMIGAFLLVWLALARVKARLQPSQPCTRCGAAASRRYDAEEVPRGICSACYHAFLNPRARVEAGMKIRKERQVAAYRRRYGTSLRVLSAIPGAGHLYGGAVVVGTLLVLAFTIAVGVAALAFGPMPWPQLSSELPSWILGGLVAFVLVVVYGIALQTLGRLTGR